MQPEKDLLNEFENEIEEKIKQNKRDKFFIIPTYTVIILAIVLFAFYGDFASLITCVFSLSILITARDKNNHHE